jgi:hypothetical protein
MTMKRIMWTMGLALVFALAGSIAGAQDLAFSIGAWSFFRSAGGDLPSRSPGLFASFGACYGLTPRLEAGASVVPRLAPAPFDDLFVEEHVGISLIGDRVSETGGPAIYINTLLDIGILFGAHNVISGAPGFSRALFLRLTPLALGNPYYGRRDRMFSTGLIYDYDAGSVSLFMNIIAADFYLASPSKSR